MKNHNYFLLILSVFLLGFFSCSSVKKPSGAKSKTSFYNLSATSLEGSPIDFETLKGKKVLLVNVASNCGLTPQYEGLQELYDTYRENLVIIGFPANDFGNQEPGSNEEIGEFCERNYGVTFLMSEKVSVKGEDTHPVFVWLSTKDLNGWNSKAPLWNFHKYLVDESGELAAVFPPNVKPQSKKILKYLK
jgi:glutathione peroxidase